MSVTQQTLVYEKISKTCKIAIPVIYLAALITFIGLAMFAIMIFGDGTFKFHNTEAANITFASKIVLSISAVVMLYFLLRIFWLILHVAKRFKAGQVFDDTTAEYARLTAFNFLLFQVVVFILSVFPMFLVGEVDIDIINRIISIVFAYLFAWVLRVGCELKAENDLTV
jgi:hypothetical protein